MSYSKIAWTERTWNPATGCERVSDGCTNCYALTLVNTRMQHNPRSARFGHPFEEVMLHENRLNAPTTWKQPCRIFVNSMSDLWHRDIPDPFIDRVFAVMEATPRHTFQVLTKRSERMRRYVNARYPGAPCPAHIWIGVSVEDNRVSWRADDLRRANASVRWISAEPLLGPLDDVSLERIDWLVAGGESGNAYRPMDIAWARDLRDRCADRGIAFFTKQDSGPRAGQQGRIPDDLWIKEYPAPRERDLIAP
jgi:protein gp37